MGAQAPAQVALARLLSAVVHVGVSVGRVERATIIEETNYLDTVEKTWLVGSDEREAVKFELDMVCCPFLEGCKAERLGATNFRLWASDVRGFQDVFDFHDYISGKLKKPFLQSLPINRPS